MTLRPLILMALLATACGTAHTSSDGGSADGGAHTPVLKTVFVISMENRNWDDVKGSQYAPYLNGLLAQAAHAENYSNPPSVHPSLPNYLWMEAGTNFGVGMDGDPSQFHQSTTQHLVTLLESAGVTWKSYVEDIDGKSCPLTGVMNYAPKHTPFVYFDDVTDNLSPTSQRCISHIRPYSELAGDLESGKVAQYNFLSPDLCDDGHNDCIKEMLPEYDEITQTDTWLKNNLPAILNSSAYKDGGAVFITWDESEPSGTCATLDPACPIGMIVLSPYAKTGYSNSIMYDHSSLLRTLEEIYKVQPFLGGAANATDLSDLFQQFP